MKNGIPAVYLAFRTGWGLLHLALLGALAVVLVRWWFHDDNGSLLVSNWWTWSGGVQTSIFNSVPFPWD